MIEMQTITIIEIIAVVALFFIAAFLALAETSITGMSRLRVLSHVKNNHPLSKYLSIWLQEPNKLLATLLIYINTVAISASTIGTFLSVEIAKHFKFNLALTATVVATLITIILIVFGEITPKVFAIQNTERLGLFLIRPVVFCYKLTRPLTMFFLKFSNIFIRMVGGQPAESIPIISAKDISTVIDVGAEAGYIDEQSKTMMSSILEFKDMQVKDIKIPRTEIVGIDISWEPNKIIDKVVQDGYSRLPVYKEDLDHIVGILYSKDMLYMIKNRGLVILQDIVRIPYFVPGTKKTGELLKEFKKGKIHMAIIVDEFGGTSGLITLEDIIEEIVGDIQDEYDVADTKIEPAGKNMYIVDGDTEIEKLVNNYKIELPKEENINTIGGFVSAICGRVPREGEHSQFGKIHFTILSADERRILKIKIEIKDGVEAGKKQCDPPEKI